MADTVAASVPPPPPAPGVTGPPPPPPAPAVSVEEQKTKNTALLKACKATPFDVDEVRALLDGGADAAYSCREEGTWGAFNQESPIHGVMEALSRALYDQNNDDSDNDTSEAAAGFASAMAVLKLLLSHGADVNAAKASSDWRGCGRSQSALRMGVSAATQYSQPELLDLMLKHGGDANSKEARHVHSMRTDGHVSTPLIYSTVNSRAVACVEVLIAAGADVNAVFEERMHNERGYNSDTRRPPLCCVAGWEADDGADCSSDPGAAVQLASALLRGGADVNAWSRWIEHRQNGLVSPHDDPRDDCFVQTHDNVLQRATALASALQKKQYDVATLLVAFGASLDLRRHDGQKTTTMAEVLQPLVADTAAAGLFRVTPGLTEFLPEDTPLDPVTSTPTAGCLACEHVSAVAGAEEPCIRCAYGLPLAPVNEADDFPRPRSPWRPPAAQGKAKGAVKKSKAPPVRKTSAPAPAPAPTSAPSLPKVARSTSNEAAPAVKAKKSSPQPVAKAVKRK